MREVSAKARARVPCLRRAEIDRENCWAGLYEVSPDKHALLGRAPGFENFYLANGSSGHGVMTARGNTYTSVFTSYEGDKATPFRQTIEFLDDDHVMWTVLGKKGDEWVTLHQVKEARVKESAAK